MSLLSSKKGYQYLLRVYIVESTGFCCCFFKHYNFFSLFELSPLFIFKLKKYHHYDINNVFLNSRAYRQAFLCMFSITFFDEYKHLEEND